MNLEKSIWRGNPRAVREAQTRYDRGELGFVALVSTYYSFRFLPSSRRQLRAWCEDGTFTIRLQVVTEAQVLDQWDCDMVDVLTRVLLWCGDETSAMNYADVAIRKRETSVNFHTSHHLTITNLIASLRFGEPRKDIYDFLSHVHASIRSVEDSLQWARVLAGYAMVAAEYDMLGHAMKFGWRAVHVKGMTAFVRAKAIATFVSLPFLWFQALIR